MPVTIPGGFFSLEGTAVPPMPQYPNRKTLYTPGSGSPPPIMLFSSNFAKRKKRGAFLLHFCGVLVVLSVGA